MAYLDKQGLGVFFTQLKNIFGYKSNLDNSMDIRRQYLLEIDYENTLAFDTKWIVPSNNSPYVGMAVVGATYVA